MLYKQLQNLVEKNRVVDEIKKKDEEYSSIMDQPKNYLFNQMDESSNIIGILQSKVRRLQYNEIDVREKIKKKLIKTQSKTWRTGTSTNWIGAKIQNGNASFGW